MRVQQIIKCASAVIICSFLIAFSGCKKDDDNKDYQTHGEIVGVDYSLCSCCGGWLVEYVAEDDDGVEITRTTNFYKLPNGSNIDLENATFPVPVKFDYHFDKTGCMSMIIDRIELR